VAQLTGYAVGPRSEWQRRQQQSFTVVEIWKKTVGGGVEAEYGGASRRCAGVDNQHLSRGDRRLLYVVIAGVGQHSLFQERSFRPPRSLNSFDKFLKTYLYMP